jgi:hypothetical protein
MPLRLGCSNSVIVTPEDELPDDEPPEEDPTEDDPPEEELPEEEPTAEVPAGAALEPSQAVIANSSASAVIPCRTISQPPIFCISPPLRNSKAVEAFDAAKRGRRRDADKPALTRFDQSKGATKTLTIGPALRQCE